MGYHASLSPSGAHRWAFCTASPGEQEGIEDDGSEAARLGTACHQMSAEILQHGVDPQSYLGRKMLFWIHPESDSSGEDWEDAVAPNGVLADPCLVITHEVVVDQAMIDAVVSGTSFVRQLVETEGGALEVEQSVPVGHITGEIRRWTDAVGNEVPAGTPGAVPQPATGSSDVVRLLPDRIHILDFKYGRHKVHAYEVVTPGSIDPLTGEEVPPVLQANLQMAMYALGALEKFGPLYDFKDVTMTIVQPFMSHVSEYTCSVEELLKVGEFLKERAEETRTSPTYRPSFDACHFCRAKGACEAQTRVVLETALDGFDDVDQAKPRPITVNKLGSLYAAIEMITDWCKAVETRVFEELKAGRPVVRNDGISYKLVAGKKGARQWRDEAEAESLMKRMRLKQEQMYSLSLISPAQVEKLAVVKKAKKGQTPVPPILGPTQWARLQSLMHQKDGSPTVALETDPRPAIASAVDDFDDVTTAPAAEDCADLFS